MRNKKKKLLVCDLDNTLYDWVRYFVRAFYAMVDKTVELTGCNRQRLLDDFKRVHQYYHDSEHPFSLLETETIVNHFRHLDRGEIYENLDPAFHAFNSVRKRELSLHETVRETLETLVENDIVLVAHTDSKLFGTVDRIRRLGLTSYFSKIYCRERVNSTHPNSSAGSNWLDDFPLEKVIELSRHQMKPDPSVLLEICEREGFQTTDCAYVGDSIARDILMAKRAGAYAIWAAYGAHHDEDEYARLVRISHWTEEDVKRERELKEEAKKINPDFIMTNSFSEVLLALGLKSRREKRLLATR